MPLSNILKRPLHAYLGLLSSRPLATRTATGFFMSGAGDLIAQVLESDFSDRKKNAKMDIRRFCVFAFFGAFWTGPVNSTWLPILNRLVDGNRLFSKTLSNTASSSSVLATMVKVAIQQLAWNPLAFMPAFYCAYGLGYGLGLQGTLDKAKPEYWTSLVACWQIWVPGSFIAFRFSTQYQSVVMAVMNLIWNTRLSWESHKRRRDAAIVSSH